MFLLVIGTLLTPNVETARISDFIDAIGVCLFASLVGSFGFVKRTAWWFYGSLVVVLLIIATLLCTVPSSVRPGWLLVVIALVAGTMVVFGRRRFQ